ncbi:MAG: hypothetical protein LBI29_00305 [Rickettsiales bacterium]|jgi:hypothetical protein|nr:hypothetical protein [Rickettsiales bacterium]
MSSNNDKENVRTIAIGQSIYEILEVMAECYNVDKESIVEMALKMFFSFEIKIDRLRKEGIGRDEIYRHSTDKNSLDEERGENENVVTNLKFV